MFAFGLYDRRAQTLVLARDRLGIKPLHVFEGPGAIMFASLPDAFRPWLALRPNMHSVSSYLLGFGGPTTGDSFYDQVEILPPGAVLRIRQGGNSERSHFFVLRDFADEAEAAALAAEKPARLLDRVDELLQRSVKNQLRRRCAGGRAVQRRRRLVASGGDSGSLPQRLDDLSRGRRGAAQRAQARQARWRGVSSWISSRFPSAVPLSSIGCPTRSNITAIRFPFIPNRSPCSRWPNWSAVRESRRCFAAKAPTSVISDIPGSRRRTEQNFACPGSLLAFCQPGCASSADEPRAARVRRQKQRQREAFFTELTVNLRSNLAQPRSRPGMIRRDAVRRSGATML